MKNTLMRTVLVSMIMVGAAFASENKVVDDDQYPDNLSGVKLEQLFRGTIPMVYDVSKDVYFLTHSDTTKITLGDIRKIATESKVYGFLLGLKYSFMPLSFAPYGNGDYRNELCAEAMYQNLYQHAKAKLGSEPLNEDKFIESFKEIGTNGNQNCEELFKMPKKDK